MKKLFLKTFIIISLFFVCNVGISQNYIPLPDSGIVWRQTSVRFDQATTTQVCWENQFELKGEDTIINSLTYTKLYYTGSFGANGNCNVNTIYNQNNWAIRETGAKRIYIFEYSSGQEYLLYDFNLGVNDTISTVYAYSFHGLYDNFTEVITSIDSVSIDNTFHKAYNITSTNWMGVVVNYVQLIEGIGSTFGLFADNSPNWAEKYDYLNCVHINNQVVYFQTQPCSLLTSVDDNLAFNEENFIKIYPNPVSNELFILNSFGNSILYEYSIYDLIGTNVITGQLYISGLANKIDIFNLKQGMYILKLSHNSTVKVLRFLKI